MFINTSNRFTGFYNSHKTTIDTLLLLVQLVAMAIALLTLLSLLGWALAISEAIAWLDRLVEDSLESQRLLMPAIGTLDAVDNDVPTVPNTDAILTEWQEIAQRWAGVDEVSDWQQEAIANQVNELQGLSIRQLKKLASDRKISGYSNLTKRELILALN
jgi:Rho termination factor, N-terminal domain